MWKRGPEPKIRKRGDNDRMHIFSLSVSFCGIFFFFFKDNGLLKKSCGKKRRRELIRADDDGGQGERRGCAIIAVVLSLQCRTAVQTDHPILTPPKNIY